MEQRSRENFKSMSELDSDLELIIITSENEVTLPDEWNDLVRSLRKHASFWYDLGEYCDY